MPHWTAAYEKPSDVYKDCPTTRDFVGYGGTSPGGAETWPNGAKVFVFFVLNYEEGGENTVLNGDKGSEPFLHDLAYFRSAIEGTRDPNVEDLYDYGTRAGFPRILKLFKTHEIPFTVWAVGRALEVSQPYAQEMVKHGHELACHGWRWRKHVTLSGPDEEAEGVATALDKMQQYGDSESPSGWYIGTRFPSMKFTRAKVHKDKGVPLLYCSDCYQGDLPYWIPSPLTLEGAEDEGMLMIPYSLVNNDHRFLAIGYGGWATADEYFEQLKAEFDQLYAEGCDGQPKMMTVALHNRIIGKPGKFRGLQRFVEYVTSKEDVLIDTRRNVAKYWRAKYPYKN